MADAAEAAPAAASPASPANPSSRFRRGAARALRVMTWPVDLALSLTIVDSKKARLRRFYPLTFILCVVWIALAAYLVSWTLSVIGMGRGFPDTVVEI